MLTAVCQRWRDRRGTYRPAKVSSILWVACVACVDVAGSFPHESIEGGWPERDAGIEASEDAFADPPRLDASLLPDGEVVTPPRVGWICVGDSLTHGTGAPWGESWPDQAVKLYGITLYWNFGAPGYTTDDLLWDGPLIDRWRFSAPSRWLLVMIGTNDYLQTVDHAVEGLHTYVLGRRAGASGTKVLVITIPRSRWIPPAWWTEYNGRLRAGEVEADRIVDVAGTTVLGEDEIWNDPTLYSDLQVHLTAKGYGIIAKAVASSGSFE